MNWNRLRNVFRPSERAEAEDEVRFHIEERTRELIERGVDPARARAQAEQRFGPVHPIEEALVDSTRRRRKSEDRAEAFSDLAHDMRYALRSLARNRGFAVAAIATLALGIGANSAIFSIVNSVLLRPLPFPDAERLVVVHGFYPNYGRSSVSLPDFRDWRDGAKNVALAARHQTAYNYMSGDEPVQLKADRVSANFFQTLGVAPMIGRGFRPEEEVGGDDFVAVLSHGFWQRAFGGDAAIVGKSIQLSGRPYTVIGVAPPTFRFWRDVDLWTPAEMDRASAQRRSEFLTAFGRLKPGATVDQARTEMATIADRLGQQYPQTNSNFRNETVTLHDQTVAAVRPALIVFAAAVGLVLLIACANVANLLMARAAAREREMAVRSALGASRSRLLRQLLTESTAVALLGGLTGLLLATWAVGALRGTGTTLLPRLGEVKVDGVVVLFSLGLAVATGMLFGLAPAMRLASAKLHETIKEGARGGSAGGGATRFRNSLVLAEVALAVMLLVGAGLLIRSFEKLNRVNPGFNPKGIVTYYASFPAARYAQVTSLVPIYDQLAERTRAVPGVRSVSLSATLPMQGSGYISFAVEGRPTPPSDANTPPEDVQPFSVSPDYLKVMGLKLLNGRFIEAGDVDGRLDVAVINSEFARRFIVKGKEAIGSRVTFGNPADTTSQWFTVVGIVETVAQEGLDAKPYPQIYMPMAQAPRRGFFVSARTEGDPLAVVNGMRAALKSVDPEIPMNDVRTMEGRVADSIAAPRVSVAVLTLFAALAMVLAAIGIYGVLSYSVAQRTREIGIRMALGANAARVRRLIVRQGMAPAMIGLAIGLVGAAFGTKLMENLLFGVQPTDTLTFVFVAAFLAAVAFVASYVPAVRATRVAPTEALRYD